MNQALASIATPTPLAVADKCVLVIGASNETVSNPGEILSQQGFEILLVRESKQALNLFANKRIDYVIIDLDSIDMSGVELIYSLRICISDHFIPIIVIASSENEEVLFSCLSAGCDDFLVKPFSHASLKARLISIDQVHKLKSLYKESIDDQLVARKVLAFALSERNIQFEEVDLLSQSKAVFSGDLFLTARHPDGGLHVLLADFTGHGLPAAIGALPVAGIFSVMTEKGFEVEEILENINNKIYTLLPVGMFMACIMLKVNSDLKHVSIWNGGMPDIYLRDSQTGEVSQKIHSSHLALGITESMHGQYVPETITTQPNEQLIIYSDGLIEATNSNDEMFGYERLELCLKRYRSKKSIFSFLVEDFNTYCEGNIPDDDVTLACIPCTCELTEIQNTDSQINVQL